MQKPLFTEPEEQKIAQTTLEVLREFERLPTSADLKKPEGLKKSSSASPRRCARHSRACRASSRRWTSPSCRPDHRRAPNCRSTFPAFRLRQSDPSRRVSMRLRWTRPCGITSRSVRNSSSSSCEPERSRTSPLAAVELSNRGWTITSSRRSSIFDDVSYDENAELLYDLAGQAVKHFRTYLSEEDTVRVLRGYQRPIAINIHAQMHEPGNDPGKGRGSDHPVVRAGFTTPKTGAFSIVAGENVTDFRIAPADKTKIQQILYGGFRNCLHRTQRVQADDERLLAIILDLRRGATVQTVKGSLPDLMTDRAQRSRSMCLTSSRRRRTPCG